MEISRRNSFNITANYCVCVWILNSGCILSSEIKLQLKNTFHLKASTFPAKRVIFFVQLLFSCFSFLSEYIFMCKLKLMCELFWLLSWLSHHIRHCSMPRRSYHLWVVYSYYFSTLLYKRIFSFMLQLLASKPKYYQSLNYILYCIFNSFLYFHNYSASSARLK